jgi:preprotein translocase subunit SecA
MFEEMEEIRENKECYYCGSNNIYKYGGCDENGDAMALCYKCANGGGMAHPPYVRGYKKIGRNEPCHCGSGRKYKKCCLDRDSYGRI